MWWLQGKIKKKVGGHLTLIRAIGGFVMQLFESGLRVDSRRWRKG